MWARARKTLKYGFPSSNDGEIISVAFVKYGSIAMLSKANKKAETSKELEKKRKQYL
jgi:hypothetical protein